jgi:hypothetical protein
LYLGRWFRLASANPKIVMLCPSFVYGAAEAGQAAPGIDLLLKGWGTRLQNATAGQSRF